MRQVIRNCKTGEVASLADRLRALLLDEKLRSSMGHRNKTRVRSNYSVQAGAAGFRSLYQKILEGPGR